MTVLSKETLKNLIKEKNIISDYKDIDYQITANGFDFRLAVLIEVKKAGQLRIDKNSAIKPKLGNAYVLKGFENHIKNLKTENIIVLKEGTLIYLDEKKTYLAVTCEKLNTPENTNFEIEPRSSLFRYCQCDIVTGFGEAGYRGILTVMFKPSLPGAAIDIGVRFMQVSFNILDSNAHYNDQKENNYQGGNIL
ncbi:MAG: hypothetical protein K0B07_03615 [DPANN group archaeon]|nr:hypothetical protein [DPANN group archaeon]